VKIGLETKASRRQFVCAKKNKQIGESERP